MNTFVKIKGKPDKYWEIEITHNNTTITICEPYIHSFIFWNKFINGECSHNSSYGHIDVLTLENKQRVFRFILCPDGRGHEMHMSIDIPFDDLHQKFKDAIQYAKDNNYIFRKVDIYNIQFFREW